MTLCILLVAACSLIGYGLLSYRSVRAQFLVREADLTLRENDLTKKEEDLKEQQEELQMKARAEIEALQGPEIAALNEQLSGAKTPTIRTSRIRSLSCSIWQMKTKRSTTPSRTWSPRSRFWRVSWLHPAGR